MASDTCKHCKRLVDENRVNDFLQEKVIEKLVIDIGLKNDDGERNVDDGSLGNDEGGDDVAIAVKCCDEGLGSVLVGIEMCAYPI